MAEANEQVAVKISLDELLMSVSSVLALMKGTCAAPVGKGALQERVELLHGWCQKQASTLWQSWPDA